uniref:Ig-like domain-containing protein n=1 Tax=Neogobius melanostomus TaxID=47308 RepID=A0A8C6SIB1_9GOBI
MCRRLLFDFLLPMLLQVALADDLPPVSAYVGKNVTLRSGADPSWKLSRITWSIWANTTWIATYYSKATNVNHFYRYQNRLHLNTSTGDLVIEHLKSEDEMEYTVDFFNSQGENKVNKIKLSIKQHLRHPTIRTWLSREGDSCVFGLRCSSPDSGVTLSWKTEPHFQSHSESSDELTGFLNKTQSIKFTCVSSKNNDNASKSDSLKCEDLPPPVTSSAPTTPPASDCRVISRDPVFLVPGFFMGAAVVIVCYCIQQRRKCGSRNISDN